MPEEKLIPDENAILIAKVVEIFAGALAHPIADHRVIGLLVQADLRFQAIAADSFHRFVNAPVAALADDGNAVDADRQVVGIGH